MPQWHKSNSGMDQITVCIFVGAQAQAPQHKRKIHTLLLVHFVLALWHALLIHYATDYISLMLFIQPFRMVKVRRDFSRFYSQFMWCVVVIVGKKRRRTTNLTLRMEKRVYDRIFNRLLFIIHAQNPLDSSVELNSIYNIFLPEKETTEITAIFANVNNAQHSSTGVRTTKVTNAKEWNFKHKRKKNIFVGAQKYRFISYLVVHRTLDPLSIPFHSMDNTTSTIQKNTHTARIWKIG